MRRCMLLIAFVFGFVSLAVPASASAKVTVALTVSSGTVAPHKAYRLTGHVLPAAVRGLALQALVGPTWKTVGTGTSDKRGTFTLSVIPKAAGALKLRVQVLSGTVVLSTSPLFTLFARTPSSVTSGFTYATSVQALSPR